MIELLGCWRERNNCTSRRALSKGCVADENCRWRGGGEGCSPCGSPCAVASCDHGGTPGLADSIRHRTGCSGTSEERYGAEGKKRLEESELHDCYGLCVRDVLDYVDLGGMEVCVRALRQMFWWVRGGGERFM
jgi:hypothetical protein